MNRFVGIVGLSDNEKSIVGRCKSFATIKGKNRAPPNACVASFDPTSPRVLVKFSLRNPKESTTSISIHSIKHLCKER